MPTPTITSQEATTTTDDAVQQAPRTPQEFQFAHRLLRKLVQDSTFFPVESAQRDYVWFTPRGSGLHHDDDSNHGVDAADVNDTNNTSDVPSTATTTTNSNNNESVEIAANVIHTSKERFHRLNEKLNDFDREIDELNNGVASSIKQFDNDVKCWGIPHQLSLKLGIASRDHEDVSITSFLDGKHIVCHGREFSGAFVVEDVAPKRKKPTKVWKMFTMAAITGASSPLNGSKIETKANGISRGEAARFVTSFSAS
eukprot:scaffold119_cov79-Skeletonema_dohrnii-CCMP3373.AAC.8